MKIGVVGCGAVARSCHLPALAQIPNVEIWSVCDIDENKLDPVVGRYSIPKVFHRYEDMLRDPCLDVVIVSTPPQAHGQLVREAARCKKHVIVEKPFTLSLSDALMTLDEVERNSVGLRVVNQYRFCPVMKRGRELVEEGRFGRIVSIQATGHIPIPMGWTAGEWMYDSNIGVLYDFAPHVVDAVLQLVGSPPKDVQAYGGDFLSSMGCDNYAQILILFENGAVSSLDLSWLSGARLFALLVQGSAGYLGIDIFNDACFEFHKSPTPADYARNTLRMLTGTLKNVSFGRRVDLVEAFRRLIEDFLEGLDSGTNESAHRRSILDNVAVLQAARLSLKESKRISIDSLYDRSGELKCVGAPLADGLPGSRHP